MAKELKKISKSATPKTEAQADTNPKIGERIAKVIARSGYCSRREAEKVIEEGRVKVNGKAIISPALNVTDNDVITIDNEPLQEADETRLWIYHKPAGLVTTHSDPEGRPTVFENLPEDIGRVISIGRLDLNSEGLLLLTNDGELARILELPLSGIERVYRARAFGEITQEKLNQLQDGVIVDGVHYGAIDAILEHDSTKNAWIRVALREGKNREVRKVLAGLGLQVNRLIRIKYGDFELGTLERGEVIEVPESRVHKTFNKLLKLSMNPRRKPLDDENEKSAPLVINTDAKPAHKFGRDGAKRKFGDRPKAFKKPEDKVPEPKEYNEVRKTAKKGWAKAGPLKAGTKKVVKNKKFNKSFEKPSENNDALSKPNEAQKRFGKKSFSKNSLANHNGGNRSETKRPADKAKKMTRRELERQPLETRKSLSLNKPGKSFKKSSKRPIKPTR